MSCFKALWQTWMQSKSFSLTFFLLSRELRQTDSQTESDRGAQAQEALGNFDQILKGHPGQMSRPILEKSLGQPVQKINPSFS